MRRVFFFLVLLALSISSPSIGDDGCERCHSGEGAKRLGLKDVYREIDSFRFQHPDVKKKCDECHVERRLKEASVKRLRAVSLDYLRDQVFLVEGLSPDREYLLEVKMVDRSGNRTSIPPSKVIPSKVKVLPYKDSIPPVIRDVEVEDLKQGVFIEATLRWETDEFSSSLVEYGLTPRLGERIGSERVFSLTHRVTIPGLARGKRYYCRITSRDLFGNVSVFEGVVIDTSKKVKGVKAFKGRDRVPPRAGKISLFRVEGSNDLYVRVSADEDVKATLFVTESVKMDEHGFGLLPPRKAQIDVCIRCHPQGVSHPVGIRSRSGSTVIPPDLPTIQGGVMTCITCHYPHGGNRRYFARMEMKRAICITCHIERK